VPVATPHDDGFSRDSDVNGYPPLKHPFRTYFRFARYVLPYWDKVLFCMLIIVVVAPMTQIQLLFGKAIIDQAVMNEHETIASRISITLIYTALGAMVLWAGQLLERLGNFFEYYIGMFVTLDLRRVFYRHLHRLPYKFFQDRPIGEHMYRCLQDITAETFPFTRGIVDMITTNPITAFRHLNELFWQSLVVFVLNPMTALLVAITLPFYVTLGYWMNTRIKRAFLEMKKEEQLVPAILRDSIAGVETVKSYGRRRFLTTRYVRQLIVAIRAGLRRDYLTVAYLQFVLWVLDLIAVGGLWTFLVYQLMIGQITVGAFPVLLNLSTRFIGPFKMLVDLFMTVRQQLVPTQRVLETLDVQPAIQDRPDARRMPRVQGRIRFEDVSFAYDPTVPVLKNISFDIMPGRTLGIVGRSGAGKTTILNLLLRLHRPDHGRILIDDHDLDGIRIADWQHQVSTVLQNTHMFGGDVSYNVRYGRLDANNQDVWNALEMAEADEFVRAMPEGIGSDLAEGARLSGGQKQRLGIARALVRRPQVLIFDEPTSSLDSRTENEIWRSFERAMERTTAIVISHRLSTVRKADHIIVLDQGEIVERGSHEELVRAGGLYARMWRDQTGAAA
jgi:subfamily B ATP-binding cassette protein MsbA